MPDATLSQQPKLLDEVRQVLRLHHYSIHIERAYVDWIVRFRCCSHYDFVVIPGNTTASYTLGDTFMPINIIDDFLLEAEKEGRVQRAWCYIDQRPQDMTWFDQPRDGTWPNQVNERSL